MAAKLTACWPEPQKRLSVTPGVRSGQPAASTAMRAMYVAVVADACWRCR